MDLFFKTQTVIIPKKLCFMCVRQGKSGRYAYLENNRLNPELVNQIIIDVTQHEDLSMLIPTKKKSSTFCRHFMFVVRNQNSQKYY